MPDSRPSVFKWSDLGFSTVVVTYDRRTGKTRTRNYDAPGSRRLLLKTHARFESEQRAVRWPDAVRVKREYRRRRR